MILGLNAKLVMWIYLKSWLAVHFIRGTVPCIVKINLPLLHIILQKKFHCVFREAQCRSKLCVKDGPGSLKPLRVNKLQILLIT